jgi:hypothetical protein
MMILGASVLEGRAIERDNMTIKEQERIRNNLIARKNTKVFDPLQFCGQ